VAARRPAPTVIVLHGAGLTASWTAARSGFAEAAAARGFAAVFPDGLGRQWNDGREGSSVDDAGFLRQLVRELVGRGVAQSDRIYMAGISNGGMMTFRMLCETPRLLAGAATVIANMPEPMGATCRIGKPVPLVMLNGTADPLVPYGGGGVGFLGLRGTVWSSERTAAFVAHNNGCRRRSTTQLPQRGPTDATSVKRIDWSDCSSGAGVKLYRVEGGGHQLFGRTNFLPFVFGRGTQQVSAPDIIVAAFAGAGG
jgi:polyhydroxybutyrate depolymerase